MVDEFIKAYAKKISSKPELVEVKTVYHQNNICDIVVYASDVDVGRLVGKNGKMIGSLKTIISACKAKDGVGYRIVVEAV